jgi:hypothetical protein
VALEPIPARLLVPAEFTVTALGQAVRLPGQLGFATGDAIPGSAPLWTTSAQELHLTADGELTAFQNGTYAVTASSGSLSAEVAVTVASPPVSMSFTAGAGQQAYPREAVAEPPAVVVRDAAGYALRGVPVAFEADSGLWTLGRHGLNTLRASLPGAPAVAAATREATALNPCARPPAPIAVGETVDGRLEAGFDCQSPSQLLANHSFDLTQGTIVPVSLESDDMNPAVFLRMPQRQVSGRAAQTPGLVVAEHLIVQSGPYTVLAGTAHLSSLAEGGAAYRLRLHTVSEPQASCVTFSGGIGTTYATHGSVAHGRVTAADCRDTLASDAGSVARHYDSYRAPAGRRNARRERDRGLPVPLRAPGRQQRRPHLRGRRV